MSFNITNQTIPALNNTLYRQPRFGYIPFIGLLLANILSNSVLAKYAPLGALRLSYEPLPWLRKPTHYQNAHESIYWHPIDSSHSTTGSSSETAIHHHHHIPLTNQQQVVNIHDRPTEIIIGDTGTDDTEETETTLPPTANENIEIPAFKNNIEKPTEQSAAAPVGLLALLTNSTTPSSRKVKRGTGFTKIRKNNKFISHKRRRPTTPDYYYDTYEDTTPVTKRHQQKKKAQTKRPIVDSFEESESSLSQSYSEFSGNSDEYDYDSYEITTKPHKKRRRTTVPSTTSNRPKRIKNKYNGNRKQQKINRYDVAKLDDTEYDTERDPTTTTDSFNLRQQELILRKQEHLQRQQEALLRQQEFLQRQTNGNPSITTTDATTTSEPSTPATINTIIIPGNLSTNNTNINTTGYGYGPSNGYDSISITYSPSNGGGISSGSGGFSPSYSVPSQSYGAPAYSSPSPVYSRPNPPAPNPSYGPPSPSYGPPSPSYGPPSNTLGVPGSMGKNPPTGNGYYQLPFTDWYSNEVSRNSIVKKVQDIIGFENVF